METAMEAGTFDALLADIVARLQSGRRVRRNLPGKGRLHIERPLPFLCLFRRPADRPDPGTDWLVVGEGSYLIADAKENDQAQIGRMVCDVSRTLADHFGAVLLIELWSGRAVAGDFAAGALRAEPCFRVRTFDAEVGRPTIAALVRGLRKVRIAGHKARVELLHGEPPAPPGMPALLSAAEAGRIGLLNIGLEVPPLYQDPATGQPFPGVLRRLRRSISRVLQQASFRFAHHQTSHRPDHYLRLGQSTVLRVAIEADNELAKVAQGFDLLLEVTPVNAEEAWSAYRKARYRGTPHFHYRLASWDPELLKRRLYRISLERVEDPAMAELLRDKREELDRQITLVHDRNTPRFIYGSLQLYGGDDPGLVETAEQLLATISPPQRHRTVQRSGVRAAQFAARAREEISAYQRQWPEMKAMVEVREDVPGLMVSRNRLLVPASLNLASSRLEPLLHHEVGTHLVTYCNAVAQPLALLRTGLPGYDELQEGTGVLAEYLVGGMTAARLRLLAARVVAVYRRVHGHAFGEVFEELTDTYGFEPATSFTIVMRVFRGGGFTKDVVYLRGLVGLLKYIGSGGELEVLYLGKVSAAALPILRELRLRNVLKPPPMRPHYFELPAALERIERLRGGVLITDLLDESEVHP
jgi:uncharacterized protein (TIGR02421 family)